MVSQKTERLTSQKRIISEHLKSVTNHPSAEIVYKEVKKRLPQISLGTVYRILASLEKKGEVVEITHDISHYDGNTSPHLHFICERCDRISDIFRKCDVIQCQKLQNVGQINSYKIILYGFCKKCRNS